MFDMQKTQEFFKDLSNLNKRFYEEQSDLLKKHFKVDYNGLDFSKNMDFFKEFQNYFKKFDYIDLENKFKLMFEQNYEKMNKQMIDFVKLMDDAKTNFDKMMKNQK